MFENIRNNHEIKKINGTIMSLILFKNKKFTKTNKKFLLILLDFGHQIIDKVVREILDLNIQLVLMKIFEDIAKDPK